MNRIFGNCLLRNEVIMERVWKRFPCQVFNGSVFHWFKARANTDVCVMCPMILSTSFYKLFQINQSWDLVTLPSTKPRCDKGQYVEFLAWFYDFNDSPQAQLDWDQTPELCNLWSHILQIINIDCIREHSTITPGQVWLLEALSNLAKIIIRDRIPSSFSELPVITDQQDMKIARSWLWLDWNMTGPVYYSIWLFCGTLYPAYESFKAVKTKNAKNYVSNKKILIDSICYLGPALLVYRLIRKAL